MGARQTRAMTYEGVDCLDDPTDQGLDASDVGIAEIVRRISYGDSVEGFDGCVSLGPVGFSLFIFKMASHAIEGGFECMAIRHVFDVDQVKHGCGSWAGYKVLGNDGKCNGFNDLQFLSSGGNDGNAGNAGKCDGCDARCGMRKEEGLAGKTRSVMFTSPTTGDRQPQPRSRVTVQFSPPIILIGRFTCIFRRKFKDTLSLAPKISYH